MRYHELNSEVAIKVDGFFQLEKDQDALADYLVFIDQNSLKFDTILEKLHWFVDNRYYVNFFTMYSCAAIEDVHASIVGENFQFQSFMSAFKFYNDYAMKTTDGDLYLESYNDRVLAIALYLGEGNVELATRIGQALVKQLYQPATPTFLNAGKHHRGELVSCFLLSMEDSLNSITDTVSTAMQLSKIGGGLAINLSNLRAKGEAIRLIKNTAKGVIPVMKLLEDSFNYVDQMGQRKGAGAAYLNIFHADVVDFLDTKKINADEKSRIQTLSIGLVIPNKFFDLVRENKPMYLFYPHSLQRETGEAFDDVDFSQAYDDLASNPNIDKKEINPRTLLLQIAKAQFESGYPYLIFIDNANEKNPLRAVGKIKMSNLCTEIFQLQKPSFISDDREEDVIGYDVSCVLGSLNIVNVMAQLSAGGDFEEIIDVAMLALTKVTDKSAIKNAKSIRKANEMFHSVGLGVMNLQGFFVKSMIGYGSEEAKDFCHVFFSLLNYYSIRASSKIAKEKGKRFDGFEKSDYKNGKYFEQYMREDLIPKTKKMQEIFSKIKLPTKQDWLELKNFVFENGMYHSYRLAVAPTQSISYVQNATPSTMPIMNYVESRTYGNSTTYYPAPYMTRSNMITYQLAHNVDMYSLLELMAVIQSHVDQGISTTLFIDSNTSTKELMKYYIHAHKIGLKSLYYARTKNLTIEECAVCAV
ncbi:MAG: class 1b ribonucleoside-diphosphate reductase subunit alpha [Spirochaetia bacterium]